MNVGPDLDVVVGDSRCEIELANVPGRKHRVEAVITVSWLIDDRGGSA
jgi:hypothetical protein